MFAVLTRGPYNVFFNVNVRCDHDSVKVDFHQIRMDWTSKILFFKFWVIF
jgi:hypothetical protein